MVPQKIRQIGADARTIVQRTLMIGTLLVAIGSILCYGEQANASGAFVTLPIEVIASMGGTIAATVTVPPQKSTDSPITTLWMKIHGLEYDGQASVQINGGPWTVIKNSTVHIADPGKSYGGIGGGFATLTMTVGLTAGAVKSGTNTVNFRFNGTNGNSIGFRVLDFNFVNAAGQNILPASTFVQDNPALWQPPLADSASQAAGKKLYQTASLVGSSLSGAPVMQAHCMDCHTQDGRDLKYFNFSNGSIIERAKFHGLSQRQGMQIASYIRSLQLPAPGRPWNPPYQPGVGLDSQPLSSWSAGAGLDAVLDSDQDMVPFVFPNGIVKEAVATSKTLNLRETPIAFQLLDWNHWLPTIHPKDAWGAEFVNSGLNKRYAGEGTGTINGTVLRHSLSSSQAVAYIHGQMTMDFYCWLVQDKAGFINPKVGGSAPWTPDYTLRIYSVGLWQAVKTWELTQEFGLEAYGPSIVGPTSEARTWINSMAGNASPQASHIPQDSRGVGGNALTNKYLANAWDHLQMVVDNGNRQNSGTNPIDWGYDYGNVLNLAQFSGVPEPMRLAIHLTKGMQNTDNGIGPDVWWRGWAPRVAGDAGMMAFDFPEWNGISTSFRASLSQALIGTWFDKTRQFTPQQYYAGGMAAPDEIPINADNGRLVDRVWSMIPRFRAAGVDGKLLNSIADWAKTVWPNANWDSLKQ